MVLLWPWPRVVAACRARAGRAHWPGLAKGLAVGLAQ
jgi:hypothetical protein